MQHGGEVSRDSVSCLGTAALVEWGRGHFKS